MLQAHAHVNLLSIKNEEFKPKKNVKCIQFNQFFIHCTHNKNEINGSPKIRVKAKRTTYETEI